MKVGEFIRTQQNPPRNALAVGFMIERSAYASSQQCQKGVHPEGKGFRCPVRLWQRGVVYRFALRLLLLDWKEGECWGTVYDELATTCLGFTANQYMALPSETERYAALAPLREISVIATTKTRVWVSLPTSTWLCHQRQSVMWHSHRYERSVSWLPLKHVFGFHYQPVHGSAIRDRTFCGTRTATRDQSRGYH